MFKFSNLFYSAFRGAIDSLLAISYENGSTIKSVIFLNLENWTNVVPKFFSFFPRWMTPFSNVSPWVLCVVMA